jgi:hypothetical protein
VAGWGREPKPEQLQRAGGGGSGNARKKGPRLFKEKTNLGFNKYTKNINTCNIS